ncbi:hypothetical protein CTAYLR_005776 [Chrysophaeum taylorii]|uniref:C2 domain-containing protein n=1 Tax=Chrysophaeum taylorii TaxID=2483200 RepID=A0AAD7UN72_9STRA|nr:hypothetical protein CTAYLR_005776 [Chrysophaeum taylorii]
MFARLRGRKSKPPGVVASSSVVVFEDADPSKPPNVVKIMIHGARELLVMDKNLVSKGGSSDPFVVLKLDGEKCKTTVKKKRTNPVWNEAFELAAFDDDDEAVVDLVVWDYDAFSSPDFMGAVQIPVKSLADREYQRRWHPLLDNDLSGPKMGPRGEIEVSARWTHDPDLDAALPATMTEPEKFPHRSFNALRVVVIRARRLPIMDASVLGRDGSTDPYVALKLDAEKKRTTVKAKQLNPLWLEQFDFPVDDTDVPLEIAMFDYDIGSSDDLIGRASADLARLSTRRATRQWFEISSTRKNPHSAKLELGLRLIHKPEFELALPAHTLDIKAHKREKANELRVVVLRGRALPCLDKNLFASGGSSDPFARLEFKGVARSTTVKKRCLDPVWLEMVTFPVDDDDRGDSPSLESEELKVTVLDFDALSSPDEIGTVTLSLAGCGDRKVRRRWHYLELAEGVAAPRQRRPKVEVAWRLVHNPALEIELPKQFDDDDDKFPTRLANELRVVVVRARGLPWTDAAARTWLLLGQNNNNPPHQHQGSADPFVSLSYNDEEVRTSVKNKCLDPVWVETRALPIDTLEDEHDKLLLKVRVWDQDRARDELMGEVDVPLQQALADRAVHRQWYALSTKGKIELGLRFAHNPALVVELPDEIAITKHADRPSNELCVYVSRVRSKQALRKSDLAAVKLGFFAIGESRTTSRRRFDAKNHTTVEHKFSEIFAFDLNEVELRGGAKLDVAYVVVTAAAGGNKQEDDRALGTATWALGRLQDGLPARTWVSLGADLGKVELAARWVHNPARAVPLPRNVAQRALDATKAPNHILVVLVRASRLAVSASAVVATVRVLGGEAKTSKPLSCGTAWMQEAAFPFKRAHKKIEITLVDPDNVDELVGRCVVPVPTSGKEVRAWHKLRNSANTHSSLEVYASVAHSVDFEKNERERQQKKQEKLEIKAADAFSDQPLALVEEARDAVEAYENILRQHAQMFKVCRPPNDLEVVLVRGRRLVAGPRYEPAEVLDWIPDAFARLEVMGPAPGGLLGDHHKRKVVLASAESRVRRQERIPAWIQKFSLELPAGCDPAACSLSLASHDAAAIQPDKPTARGVLDLKEVAKATASSRERRAWRGWVELKTTDHHHLGGSMDVWARLAYNPDRVKDEALMDEVEVWPSRPINQVRVVLVAARVKNDHIKPKNSPGLVAEVECGGRRRRVPSAHWDNSPERVKTGYRVAYFRERLDFIILPDPTRARRDKVKVTVSFQNANDDESNSLGACDIPFSSSSSSSSCCCVDDDDGREARREWHKIFPSKNNNNNNDDDGEVVAEVEVVMRLTHNGALMLPEARDVADAASCTAVDAPICRAEEEHAAYERTGEAVPRWFFVPKKTDVASGPFNVATLQRLWDDEMIDNSTLVWRQGLDDWRQIDQLGPLKRILWGYPEVPQVPEREEQRREWFYYDVEEERSGDNRAECSIEEEEEEEEVGEEARGPFTIGEMRDAVETGRLNADALVWRDGWSPDVWETAGTSLPRWVRRGACEGEPLAVPDASLACEVCGGLATLHSLAALDAQLWEGECEGTEPPPPRVPRPSLRPKRGSTATATEILDGLLWASKDVLLEATHVALISHAPSPPPTPPPALSDDFLRRYGDYDGALAERTVSSLEKTSKERRRRRVIRRRIPFDECREDKEETLREARDAAFDFIENALKHSSTVVVAIVDEEGRLWCAEMVAAAYVARRDGLAGAEILKALGLAPPPMPWESVLRGVADASARGRLFCDECFQEWRGGRVDDALAGRAAAAVRRLAKRDPSLTALDLRGEPFDVDTAAVLGAVAGHAIHLATLDVSGCGLGDAGASNLAAALSHGTQGVGGRLLTLRVAHNGIGDAGGGAIAALLGGAADDFSSSPPLTALDLSHNELGGRGARALGEALRRNSCLVALSVAHNKIGDNPGGVSLFLALVEEGNATLTSLDASSNGLGHRTAGAVARALRENAVLASLALSANAKVGGEEKVFFFLDLRRENRRRSALLRLSLAYVPLDPRVLRGVARWLGADTRGGCACRFLDISSTGMRRDGAEAFADAISSTGRLPLQTLDLSGNPLGPRGAAHILAALAACRDLVLSDLSMAQCALSPDAAAALFALVFDGRLVGVLDAIDDLLLEEEEDDEKLSRLRRAVETTPNRRLRVPLTALDASDNDVGARGAKALAAALAVDEDSVLARLSLANAKLGIAGGETVATAIAALPRLRELDLGGNAIQDSGCVAIARVLPKLPTLATLNLGFNNLTDTSVDTLRAALATTSDAPDPVKLFNLTVEMEGNNAASSSSSWGVAPPHLARSKLTFAYPPPVAAAVVVETPSSSRSAKNVL